MGVAPKSPIASWFARSCAMSQIIMMLLSLQAGSMQSMSYFLIAGERRLKSQRLMMGLRNQMGIISMVWPRSMSRRQDLNCFLRKEICVSIKLQDKEVPVAVRQGLQRVLLCIDFSSSKRANTVDLCAGPRRLTKIAAHHIRSESSHLVEDPKLTIAINVNFCFKQPIFP